MEFGLYFLEHSLSNKRTYLSFPTNVFNVFRLGFYGFLFQSIIYGYLFQSFSIAVGLSFATTFIIVSAIVAFSFSRITNLNNKLQLSDLRKSLALKNVLAIETWWSYDFQMSSQELSGEGASGKSIGMANKINVYAKISASNGVGFLYEQIYLSDKFPNNHIYRHDGKIEKEKLYKVWDLDKCLNTLHLNHT